MYGPKTELVSALPQQPAIFRTYVACRTGGLDVHRWEVSVRVFKYTGSLTILRLSGQGEIAECQRQVECIKLETAHRGKCMPHAFLKRRGGCRSIERQSFLWVEIDRVPIQVLRDMRMQEGVSRFTMVVATREQVSYHCRTYAVDTMMSSQPPGQQFRNQHSA